MKKLLTCAIIFLLISGGKIDAQNLAQDYTLVNGIWKKTGNPYQRPDTLKIIHGYAWKIKKITAVQDYKKINDQWLKYGATYTLPDTVTLIHSLVVPKGWLKDNKDVAVR